MRDPGRRPRADEVLLFARIQILDQRILPPPVLGYRFFLIHKLMYQHRHAEGEYQQIEKTQRRKHEVVQFLKEGWGGRSRPNFSRCSS